MNALFSFGSRGCVRLLIGAIALWLACGPASAAEIRNAQAKRIITVGGALTEIVYALGLEDRLVGIDTTSLYPPQAHQ